MRWCSATERFAGCSPGEFATAQRQAAGVGCRAGTRRSHGVRCRTRGSAGGSSTPFCAHFPLTYLQSIRAAAHTGPRQPLPTPPLSQGCRSVALPAPPGAARPVGAAPLCHPWVPLPAVRGGSRSPPRSPGVPLGGHLPPSAGGGGPLRGSGEGEPSPRTLISHELMCFSHLFLCTSPSCALPRAHTRARPRSLALCRGLAGGGTGAGRTGASGAAMGNTPSQGMSLSLCAPILK